jgi:hypothetical protein
MDTLSRSWDLLGQSLAVLKSDKELMWLPVLSAMFCLAATAIILGIFRGKLVLGWCREGDLNPHNPFGSADFKSDSNSFAQNCTLLQKSE